jgi:hypothetical protein
MMGRRVQKTIVVILCVTAVALLGVNFYFYHFFSTHVVDHFVPATGNIYQVGMNGRTVFSPVRRIMSWKVPGVAHCLRSDLRLT